MVCTTALVCATAPSGLHNSPLFCATKPPQVCATALGLRKHPAPGLHNRPWFAEPPSVYGESYRHRFMGVASCQPAFSWKLCIVSRVVLAPLVKPSYRASRKFHKPGFHKLGFHRPWFHKLGFHRTGFHKLGFHKPADFGKLTLSRVPLSS